MDAIFRWGSFGTGSNPWDHRIMLIFLLELLTCKLTIADRNTRELFRRLSESYYMTNEKNSAFDGSSWRIPGWICKLHRSSGVRRFAGSEQFEIYQTSTLSSLTTREVLRWRCSQHTRDTGALSNLELLFLLFFFFNIRGYRKNKLATADSQNTHYHR